MTKNGLDLPPTTKVPPDPLTAIRKEILSSERRSIIKERETLTLRYRVQKRIGGDAARLAELEKGLEQDELALLELEAIAREWGLPSESS